MTNPMPEQPPSNSDQPKPLVKFSSLDPRKKRRIMAACRVIEERRRMAKAKAEFDKLSEP